MTFDPGKHKISPEDRARLRKMFEEEQAADPEGLKAWVEQFKDAEPKVTFVTRVGHMLAWSAFGVVVAGALTVLYIIARVIWFAFTWASAL